MTTSTRSVTALLAVAVLVGFAPAAWDVAPPPDEDETERQPPSATMPPLDELVGMQGVTVQPLARGGFPDAVNATFTVQLSGGATTEADVRKLAEAVSAQLTIEPEGFVGWHTHPGPAIVTVIAGGLTIVNEVDCVARVYGPGQAFVDPGQGNIHVAFNASGEETRVYAIFLDVPPGEGPTTLMEEPGNCPS